MPISERPVRAIETLDTRIRGEVVGPADPGYDQARQAWNLAADQRPALVAFPESADDVVEIVRYAGENGLRVAPQGTGHNASPLTWDQDTVLLSTSRMRGVVIDVPGRRARVGAGTLWLEVTDPRVRARAGAAGRLLARRRRRRLQPRRRRELARPQARPVGQQHPGDRDRDRRRAPAPRRRRARRRPVLGDARRRRQLRRRDRDGDRPLPARRALRRRDVLAVGALRRGPARLARVDADRAGRGHLVRPHHADPAAPGHPGDAARARVRDDRRRRHRRPRVRRRGRAGAARPGAGDRHVRHGRAGRALAAAQRPRGSRAGHVRAPAAGRAAGRGDRRVRRGRRSGIGLAAAARRDPPPRRGARRRPAGPRRAGAASTPPTCCSAPASPGHPR